MGLTLDREVRSGGLGLEAQGERRASLLGRRISLRATLEAGRDRVSESYRNPGEPETLARASGRRDRASLALGAAWQAAERLSLSATLRGDTFEDRFVGAPGAGHRALSGRLGATARLGGDDAPALRLLVSRDFAAPTLDQLYDPRPFPDGEGGSFTLSSPDLSPSRATTVQAALGVVRPSLDAELVVYRDFRDEIDFDPALFRYRNLGRSRHAGVELSLRAFPRAAVSPLVAASYRDAGSGGRRLKNIPRWELRAGATAAWGVFRGSALLRLVADRYLDDAEGVRLPDEASLEGRVAVRVAPGTEVALDARGLGAPRRAAAGYVLSETAYVLPAPGPYVRLLLSRR